MVWRRLPGHGSRRRFLGEHAARADFQVRPAAVVHLQRETEVARDAAGLIGGVIGQIGHLDLTGAQGDTHRRRQKQHVRRDKSGRKQNQFARGPDPHPERHW